MNQRQFHLLRAVTFIAVLLSFLSISPSFAQNYYSREGTGVRFRAGEGVRVIVLEKSEGKDAAGRRQDLNIAGDYLIDQGGYIYIPYLRAPIKAAGLLPDSLARRIRDDLFNDLTIKPPIEQIFCMPLIRVAVMGAVQRPGSYLIRAKDSLWELVNIAGGPANNADVRKIKVMRGGRTVSKNLLEGFENAHSLEQLGVRSGDQVIMPTYSRFTADDFLRYTSFALSAAVLYLQISDRNNR
ncbi:hypothetical protein EDS67_12245 [candidate division KSB1 bacterium]|nr:MAG: hypothetical protein EDS67_12245 [candidate division KSB1 bacterium]MBC6948989.1 hypothetical protein [candidate division KSB1 bacterium]MCE7943336.1 hypothetical protein [Chlorobi bacterium CHB1]MDL1878581.1 hypothetical protein [Cytophagia bacterium CHB2]